MKKDWQIVHDMLNGSNTSGFGYDSETRSVVAEPEVWEAYIKVHKAAAKWKNKPIPHYEDLCIVFGKDRAQGNKARDFVEMEEEANREETQHLDDDDDVFESINSPHSYSEVQPGTSNTRSKKRKNRSDPMIQAFNDAVMHLGEGLREMSNKMVMGVEREDELDKKRAMITAHVLKMESLTQDERFKASQIIRDDVEKVKTFWDLEEDHRESFVKFILKE